MPRWSPLGVKFKISDKHPRLFHPGETSLAIDDKTLSSDDSNESSLEKVLSLFEVMKLNIEFWFGLFQK